MPHFVGKWYSNIYFLLPRVNHLSTFTLYSFRFIKDAIILISRQIGVGARRPLCLYMQLTGLPKMMSEVRFSKPFRQVIVVLYVELYSLWDEGSMLLSNLSRKG